ncbi:iron-sulfur cluster co-chaperone protein HscB [Engystomops pustulosus]|uniref:iron-sulfur cluster co-chaperone protein HscB n=1 Tax=Engystomops pustulosus TaxID=76066 RepID=UPI003AFA722B
MEPAARVVWRRCAGLWRAKTFCGAVVQEPVAVVPVPRLSCAILRAPSGCRTSVPSALYGQPASLTLCCPVRHLCTAAGSTMCWSCQEVVSSSELFCPSCSSIQPPDRRKDFYQLLDCERSFNIDIQELQRKYRNLQRLLHPDYFSQKSQRERDISEKQSSLVNKAYNTLLSPLTRGIYLLSLHGIVIAEGTEGGVDTPFLFEILEINERLNDLHTEAEIEEIGTFVQDKCQSLTEDVKKAFKKDDLDGAKMFLTKMKYYSNILDQVKKKILP